MLEMFRKYLWWQTLFSLDINDNGTIQATKESKTNATGDRFSTGLIKNIKYSFGMLKLNIIIFILKELYCLRL